MSDYFNLYLFILFSVLIPFVYSQKELPGAPGKLPVPDQYNTNGINWNRTYKSTEPQQIHISFGNDAKYVNIQFATIIPINGSILKYNEKKNPKRSVIVKESEDFTFIDGGIAKKHLYLHNIRTKILKPTAIYQYQVGAITSSGIDYSPIFEFHTAHRRDLFKFLSIGDVGLNNAVSMRNVVEKSKTHEYDFIALVGDQAYDMADFNGTKGDEYMNFSQQLFSIIPILPCVGNHEVAYNFSHYKYRFNNVPYKESGSDDPLYYSIDYKTIHFISFNTEIYTEPSTPEQLQYALNWLEADLIKANKHREKRPWIIFMTHHPLYCSDTANISCVKDVVVIRNGPIDATGKASGGLESLLRKYKVDLYLAGHVHNYERTYPMANNTRLTKSYVNPPSFFHVTNGNAGGPQGTALFPKDLHPKDWSAVRYDGYGYCEFTVTYNTLELIHYGINLDGSESRIIDRVKMIKN